MKALFLVLLGACALAAVLWIAGRSERSDIPQSAAPESAPAIQSVPAPTAERVAREEPARFTPLAPPPRPSRGFEEAAVPVGSSPELAKKYAGFAPEELDVARTELESRFEDRRRELFDQRFADGHFQSRTCERSDLGERELELAFAARERGELCASRCVQAPGSETVELHSTCLSRAEHPELFALADELEWLLAATAVDDEPETASPPPER